MKLSMHCLRWCLPLLALLFLSGCGGDSWLLLDPKGPIAAEEKWLIIISFLVMLIVVVPVIIMSIWFPIASRASRKGGMKYTPNWEHSTAIEAVVWAVPIAIIVVLGTITYFTSYSLDPRKPIESDKDPLVIQVVAMDWKWLFIYPEYEIATVNEIAIPVGTPVEFLVTSDTVMNSFFIPNLGSQIYAMSGMENRLHLMAEEEGVYRGFSTNYSGFGYSGMKFNTYATTDEKFANWVADVRAAPEHLTDEVLKDLRYKSRDVPPRYFASVNPLLFTEIVERFTKPPSTKNAEYTNLRSEH